MKAYQAKFITATKEVTAKQKVALINFDGAVQLDEATKESPVLIDVDFVATIQVHNEKADNPDYQKYIFVDTNGQMYVTGSETVMSKYEDICDCMEDSKEEWAIKVVRRPSNNYKGKEFMTCEIV